MREKKKSRGKKENKRKKNKEERDSDRNKKIKIYMYTPVYVCAFPDVSAEGILCIGERVLAATHKARPQASTRQTSQENKIPKEGKVKKSYVIYMICRAGGEGGYGVGGRGECIHYECPLL